MQPVEDIIVQCRDKVGKFVKRSVNNMNKIEWMPINPCKEHYGCDEHPNFESNKCGACSRTPPIERDKYQAGVDAQKKLLEYQLKIAVTMDELKTMLKQLGANNAR